MITLEGVKKVYHGAVTPHAPTLAFHLDRFQVGDGEQVALVGPSGCGKSTLLNLIAGVLRPDQGKVEVAGRRLDRLTPMELDRFRGRTIGYVFQEFNLVGALSALENVMLGLRFGRSVPRIQWQARAREMLDRVSLGHRRNARPNRLSVGEQQRVAIARALVNHPPILLADEPTGSLDPHTAAQVFRLLREACIEGMHTLVVVTHEPTLAGQLDRRFDCTPLVHESDGPQ